jgi:hypothetical protein
MKYFQILFFSILFLLLLCSLPVNTEKHNYNDFPAFAINGITFPNDSIFNRAVTDEGNNWRIHQFLSKCKTQQAVKIGFIGGSITAGAVVTSDTNRFSTLFCKSIASCFTNLNSVEEINAGIGATDSRFGCSRVKEDLLEKKPDLIVIDFAVNDWQIGDSIYIQNCMEGLIRQCLQSANDVPVLLVFFTKGSGENVQKIHEVIGRWYKLPMLSYQDAIWPIIESNKNEYWKLFFYDDPHPNDNGHKLCAYLLHTFLIRQFDSPCDEEPAIPECKLSGLFANASILHAFDTVIKLQQKNWDLIKREKDRLYFQTVDSLDSSSLTIQYNGKEIALGIHMQPAASNISIKSEDGKIDTVINNYSSFEYTKFISFYTAGLPSQKTLKISHHSIYPFKIDYLLLTE